MAFSSNAHAQAVVTWGTATNLSTDSDVYNGGTFVSAFALNSSTDLTVNGVDFAATRTTNLGTTNTFGTGAGSLTIAAPDGASAYNPGSSLGGSSSASYNTLVGEAFYFDNQHPITLTLNGLTSGQTYTFQYFEQDRNNSGRTTVLGDNLTTPDTVGSGNNPGQYAIGTFTASGTTEAITAQSSTTGYISAVSLETSAAAPEPSTYAMFLSGALLLGLVLRRRSTV